MYTIYTVNADLTISFAAQELKKYLRMMMPRIGEIPVSLDYTAKEGFRLGLMSDFGVSPDVEDVYLDDVIYLKTDETGGIIAGSNPRSVLLAVYQFLKKNGCAWLFPGPDGERIPIVEALAPIEYIHKASYRYRGQCNEGSETQALMRDAIDFTPKIGLNTFMIEFDVPKFYYERAYQHQYGCVEPEAPLSNEQVLQWKRECEVEIQKRGLLFHDMGHGWTAEPFGFDSSDGWIAKDVNELTEEQRSVLPQINGVRQFNEGIALNTNFCMSSAKHRATVAAYIADYAEKQNNVDFLHVWLSDGCNNHCECDACIKKVPADWYVMLLNDIDDQLTKRNLRTRIVFIAYVDTLWGPLEEMIYNRKRFTMLFAPITRSYCETYKEMADTRAVKPYIRNRLQMPKGMAENLGYLEEWKKTWKGDCFCYEYHFWRAQYLDLGSMYLAKIVYEDIRGLTSHGLSGIIEDGSQRSFFPTGFPFYVYGETLFDNTKTFEQLKEEYFSAAFGENWRLATEYLDAVSRSSDFKYCKGEYSLQPKRDTPYYQPELKATFEETQCVADGYVPEILRNRNEATQRIQYVSWDLLKWHTKYVKEAAKGFAAACVGDLQGASKQFTVIAESMALLEFLRPTAYDHDLCLVSLKRILSPTKKANTITQ